MYGVSGMQDENGADRSEAALKTIYDALGIDPASPPGDVVYGAYGDGRVAYVPETTWNGWTSTAGETEFDVAAMGKVELLGEEFLLQGAYSTFRTLP